MSREKIFAVYKGDEFIDLGTKTELAKKLDLKPDTIDFYATSIYKKRIKDKPDAMIVIRIEEKTKEDQ